ncbi:uncharacterized protein BX664DRAFT_325634 [Halteromyces radiatus]|uniref:uncharacterized protein n=1 Tax=Halteromyces radiatus TaxID=101107 RepID=UPI002220909D|nr:uncharacterized protein BX664DRAFT_325634 [Halteromyces radiatus]KAI8097134.1 hypothetical protein BX664DRAFT_325634 [Halteromyces radiatus]
MNSDASGTVLGFSDPPYVSETALFSYNPLVYLYFMLAFFFVPYPLYRYVAHRYNWELNTKTGARHWSDCMLGCSYGVILFVFGNYSHSFSWITVVAFYPSLFGYGWIAELPFTKTSLPNIRNWPMGMWVVFLTALAIILAFAAFHIYLAATLTLPFVVYYVCALLIPSFFLILAILLIKEVNNNWVRSTYHGWIVSRRRRHSKKTEKQPQQQQQQTDEKTQDDEGTTSSPTPPTHGDTNPENYSSDDLEANQPVPNPYTSRISLHLHHWQIFYVLAFFTRFTHPVSQVAAGIVLACYMEGICAYGYDQLVNDD